MHDHDPERRAVHLLVLVVQPLPHVCMAVYYYYDYYCYCHTHVYIVWLMGLQQRLGKGLLHERWMMVMAVLIHLVAAPAWLPL